MKKTKLTKEDKEFLESIKNLPPKEKAMRTSLKLGSGISTVYWGKDIKNFKEI